MGALIQLVVVSAVAAVVFSACELGWTQYKTKCIYFSNKHLFWNEAEAACEKMHAYLVTIDSQDKLNYLKMFLNVFSSYRYNHFWIGAKDAPIEGQWRWVETGGSIGPFSKWLPGQPDGDTAENCAMTTWNGTDVYWMDAKCEASGHNLHGANNYICEKAAS